LGGPWGGSAGFLAALRRFWYLRSVQLPSYLRDTTLGDLLGVLHRERISGNLELVEQSGARRGSVHRIHLSRGCVVLVETPLPVPRLGEILVEQHGLVAREVKRQLLTLNRRLGEGLLERGSITPSVLDAALSTQNRLRLEALFGLLDARIVFHPRGRPELGAEPLTAEQFLWGRERRRDRAPAGQSKYQAREGRQRESDLALLGLSEEASVEQIRDAFRRLSLRFHPDCGGRRGGGAEVDDGQHFLRLCAAYHRLAS